MKKRASLLLFLLLYAGFSLYAQNNQEITVYISPVTGKGSGPGDNSYFSGMITEHLLNLGYLPINSRNDAAFTMSASIAAQNPAGDRVSGDQTLHSAEMYVLSLELKDKKTGETVVRQNLYYSDPAEMEDLIILNFNQVPRTSAYFEQNAAKAEPELQKEAPEDPPAGTPVKDQDDDDWRRKQWYLGVGVSWTPRIYEGVAESAYIVNFGGGILAEYHFLKFADKWNFFDYLSLGAGLELVPDWVAVRRNESYLNLLLGVPVLVNFVFKPSRHYLFIPYGGVNFNIPLSGEIKPPLIAWRAGLQYGIKAGPGALVIDPCFSMDIGPSSLASNPDIQYRRYMINIGIKYKYGFDDFKNFLWFKK